MQQNWFDTIFFMICVVSDIKMVLGLKHHLCSSPANTWIYKVE